ncbi:MAG: TatD family hydrolase [Rhodospirillaceae bacterium]|nr:TatD family hydrolase [Rhodospirillaceae bacterium]MBT6116769.1 TatD family hydrolase [Rhodospirillaceae bacterium]
MLVDSHCHLDFPDFAGERDEVVRRARAAGVGAFVTICTKLSHAAEIREIAASYDAMWCSVGVHPHNADEEGVEDPAEIVALTEFPKVVGIGESGLDYFYDNSDRAAQRRSFQSHIEAARDTGLPLIVHTRDADEDTVAMLRDGMADGRLKGLIHCFSTSRELAEKSIELGFYISLSGILTFKRAEELREIARDLPLDRLLVETDAPYLSPVPKRGKRNEPAFVAHTAACLAEVKGLAPDELAEATTANFFRLFEKARPVPPAAQASIIPA